MNNEMKSVYSNIVNICDFQDFVNLNIKWLCFCNNTDKKTAVYIYFK